MAGYGADAVPSCAAEVLRGLQRSCVGEGWHLCSEVLLESHVRYLQLPLVFAQLGWTSLALRSENCCCFSVGLNR